MLTELLEGRLILDQAFAADYEAASAAVRGGMKTAIARGHALFPSDAARLDRRTRLWEQGFGSSESTRPADWALFCLDERFASVPRLLAAVLPALLAGVPEVVVLRVLPQGGASDWPIGLLAALELAGQELAASATPADLHIWLEALGARGRGRCVFFGKTLSPFLAVAAQWDIPARLFVNAPRIGVAGPPDLAESARQAHPDAEIIACAQKSVPIRSDRSTQRPMRCLDAIFCPAGDIPVWEGQAPLLASPDHIWSWHFPDLHSDWFLETSLALWPEAADEGAL